MFRLYFLAVTYGIAFLVIGVCLQQTCCSWRFHNLIPTPNSNASATKRCVFNPPTTNTLSVK